MRTCRFVRAALVFSGCVVFATAAAAQPGSRFTGRLLNSFSGEPLAGVTVQLDELRLQTSSGSDGAFTFENVPPGTYHLSVRSPGFSSRRTEIT